ncbi:MAG: glycosyltransferase [Planctomycetota bacterium]|nr:glycosyltransferase [Planctomycetota bacterium]MDA1212000.1 glycosyltransferase [Planctomycetota bacterium]
MTFNDATIPLPTSKDGLTICQVLASPPGTGGLEKHVIEISGRLSERHRVIVIAPEFLREQLDARVIFEPVPLDSGRIHPGVLWRLRQAFKKHRPDVIHAHANKAAAMTNWGAWGLACHKVATVHGLKRNAKMFGTFDRVIAVSRGVGSRVSHPHIDVIYNGISRDEMARVDDTSARTLRQATSNRVVLSVGRMVPVKGFDILLDAWKQVCAENDGCELWLVGDGPERAALEDQASRLEIADRVRFLGFRTDVAALLTQIDLLAISSRREGFPYVMVEGLHQRSVVVSTRVPGAEEWLPDELLVSTEDAAALGRRIACVLNHPTETRSICEPIWNKAAAELTQDYMIQRIEQTYHATLRAA